MTTKEKELLLKDLSARLPYGVKCKVLNILGSVTLKGVSYGKSIFNSLDVHLDGVRPYLFPLSSMTEEQREEFNSLGDLEIDGVPGHREYYVRPTICSKSDKGVEGEVTSIEITQDDIIPVIDWLNKNHFDYRGLIDKGLAIDATNLNIY